MDHAARSYDPWMFKSRVLSRKKTRMKNNVYIVICLSFSEFGFCHFTQLWRFISRSTKVWQTSDFHISISFEKLVILIYNFPDNFLVNVMTNCTLLRITCISYLWYGAVPAESDRIKSIMNQLPCFCYSDTTAWVAILGMHSTFCYF